MIDEPALAIDGLDRSSGRSRATRVLARAI